MRLVLLLPLSSSGPPEPLQAQPDAMQAHAQPKEDEELALRWLLAGQLEQAADLFTKLLAASPEEPNLMEGRVRALLALERWPQALAEARSFHQQQPHAPPVESALGEALFRAGLLEEAEQLLHSRTEPAGAPGRALMTLGRLMDARGRTTQAIELMRRAVAAAPDDRTVLYWAARSTESRAEAIDLLERYLQRSEGDDPDRVETARATVLGLRALGERPIWVTGARPARQEIPLELLWNPYSGQSLGYLVAARLGAGESKPVRFLLDSGSPGLYVVERIARKRGFIRLTEITTFGGGGTGKHKIQKGFFPEVTVGRLKFTEALASSTKQELDPIGRYHGVLPLSIFNGYRMTLDPMQRRLVLELPSGESEGAPYWEIGGQLLVQARLDRGKEGLFLFDTGATRTVLAHAFIADVKGAQLGPPVKIQALGGLLEGARTLDGVKVLFQQLACGPLNLRASDMSVRSRMGGVEISGLLGLDLLAQSRLVIDSRARRIAVAVKERNRS